MNIIYSFCKFGQEAQIWEAELSRLSNERYTIVPFNYGSYLNPALYARAQMLDNLFYEKHSGLMRLYNDCQRLIDAHRADVLVCVAFPPFHPEFLLKLPLYKALRIYDGPLSAYDRDFAYLHAYNHIFYHSPAYSADLTMPEKLKYCGAQRIDFLPLELFSAMYDPDKNIDVLLAQKRDIDIIFIGDLWKNKMPTLAKVKKRFGRRAVYFGTGSLRKNVYFNVKYYFPCYFRPVPSLDFTKLYQRTKIGINIHNRGKFTTGNYRLFELPANGVCQISDGDEYLDYFLKREDEVACYRSPDELVEKIEFYLAHEKERLRIARDGYVRVTRDHTVRQRIDTLHQMLQKYVD
jgi:hypothetical protein